MENEKLSYKLQIFEGPLDLLLSLIEKNKVSIFDVPITLILEQYMEYISSSQDYDAALSSEFIDMAARLLYIKSRMLLPREESEPDPREALIAELMEYKLARDIAEYLRERYELYSERYSRELAVFEAEAAEPDDSSGDASSLYSALLNLFSHKSKDRLPPPINSITNLTSRKIISVSGRIIFILRKLYTADSAAFAELLDEGSPDEIVAVFIALLELVKSNRVIISYENLLESDIILNRNTQKTGEINDIMSV